MDRNNHYEAAFEAYLQGHGLGYVAIDESRRSKLGDEPVKNLDFIVYGPNGARLVVDVKGRRFPTGSTSKPRKVWECWTTMEDISSLQRWADFSGPGFQGIVVFAYDLQPSVEVPANTPDLWLWRGHRYLFRGIATSDYQPQMRQRSPRWGTVSLPQSVFRELVRPIRHFIDAQPLTALECPF